MLTANFLKLGKWLVIAGDFEGSVDDHQEGNSRVRNASDGAGLLTADTR